MKCIEWSLAHLNIANGRIMPDGVQGAGISLVPSSRAKFKVKSTREVQGCRSKGIHTREDRSKVASKLE